MLRTNAFAKRKLLKESTRKVMSRLQSSLNRGMLVYSNCKKNTGCTSCFLAHVKLLALCSKESGLTCISAGFPAVLYYGQEGPYHVLVLELLGPNLEELFELCGRVFTPKTVAMVGKKMVLSRF